MFTLRFDMRAPEEAAPATDLYAAAIDMCAWAETRGAVIAVLSEHHGTDDGHLPAPQILAAAIAARTKQFAILLAAVPITFWDPVRLAEEVSVLDIISKGRVSYAFGIGHRHAEYEHFGIDMHQRGKLADESLALVRRLLQGEAVDHGGRRIHVTPAPATTGGPYILVAGGEQGGGAACGEVWARVHLPNGLTRTQGVLRIGMPRQRASAGRDPVSRSGGGDDGFRRRRCRQSLG